MDRYTTLIKGLLTILVQVRAHRHTVTVCIMHERDGTAQSYRDALSGKFPCSSAIKEKT